MGHRNTQFTGHMIDLEIYPQGHNHLLPKPCIFYGSVANYPQPNIHPVAPTIGNRPNFNNHHHLPEHHGSTFYGMPQYDGIHPQRPFVNLDLSVSVSSSGHYNPYLAPPPSGIRDFPVQINHGTHNQFSPLSSQRIVGVPTDSYGRNIPYMDGVRGSFKRNNVDGAPANYQYHNVSPDSSSFVAPMTARPAESDVTSMDATSFAPPEYGGNDPAPMVESGSHRSMRNIPDFQVHNASHVIQGNYVASSVPLPGNPWFDMHFGANNGDIGAFPWARAPELPFVRASINGACVETGSIGSQGYQVTNGNQGSNGFLLNPRPPPPPPIPQIHSNPHHPLPPVQGIRGYSVNFPSQVSTSSPRISTINASNNGINPFPDVVDARPTFLAPVLPSFRHFPPPRREFILGPNARHHLPHLRVLPEDEVSILEIPGYHEAGNSIDQHIDMRLDIDHMSYEELLALGEQIGSVGTGLHQDFVRNNLKTRTSTSGYYVNLEEEPSMDERVNFCVICQTDYMDGETIGTLDCEHEYHRECIKTWLLLKNSCPICKSTALPEKGKDK